MVFDKIPQLSILCLRAIANPKCNTEATFAVTKEGQPSSASRLLRSFHHRPVLGDGPTGGATTIEAYVAQSFAVYHNNNNHEEFDVDEEQKQYITSIEHIPMKRTPSIGIGSGRREQANDIDMNHPWVGIFQPEATTNNEPAAAAVEGTTPVDETPTESSRTTTIPTNPQAQILVAELGCTALDVLQSYIDALVEMGRMSDDRLGVCFFREIKANIDLRYQTRHGMQRMAAAAAPGTEEATTRRDDDIDREEEATIADDHGATTAAATAADAVFAAALAEQEREAVLSAPIPKKRRKKRGRSGPTSAAVAAQKKREAVKRADVEAKRQAAILAAVPKSQGSLSLHNCIVFTETMNNLISSRMLPHIHTLDLTGLQTLTDGMLSGILQDAGLQLRRISVKNCRRLTDLTMYNLAEHTPNLVALDLGGVYNIAPETVIEVMKPQTIRRGRGVLTMIKLPWMKELHASGIGPKGGWTDNLLPDLFNLRGWRALSLGFSPFLTFTGWKNAIFDVESKQTALQLEAAEHHQQHDASTTSSSDTNMCQTLQSLAVPFCEQFLVDNAWLGLMGRHLPNLRALDIRGNHQLTSLTGWYDGRASSGSSGPQSLMVLARYSGVNESSVKDTKQVYPGAAGGATTTGGDSLKVVLNSDGIGWGILRQENEGAQNGGGGDKMISNHFRYRIRANKIKAKKDAAAAAEAAEKAPAPKIKEAPIIKMENKVNITSHLKKEEDVVAAATPAKEPDSEVKEETTQKVEKEEETVATTAELESTLAPEGESREPNFEEGGMPPKEEQKDDNGDIEMADTIEEGNNDSNTTEKVQLEEGEEPIAKRRRIEGSVQYEVDAVTTATTDDDTNANVSEPETAIGVDGEKEKLSTFEENIDDTAAAAAAAAGDKETDAAATEADTTKVVDEKSEKETISKEDSDDTSAAATSDQDTGVVAAVEEKEKLDSIDNEEKSDTAAAATVKKEEEIDATAENNNSPVAEAVNDMGEENNVDTLNVETDSPTPRIDDDEDNSDDKDDKANNGNSSMEIPISAQDYDEDNGDKKSAEDDEKEDRDKTAESPQPCEEDNSDDKDDKSNNVNFSMDTAQPTKVDAENGDNKDEKDNIGITSTETPEPAEDDGEEDGEDKDDSENNSTEPPKSFEDDEEGNDNKKEGDENAATASQKNPSTEGVEIVEDKSNDDSEDDDESDEMIDDTSSDNDMDVDDDDDDVVREKIYDEDDDDDEEEESSDEEDDDAVMELSDSAEPQAC